MLVVVACCPCGAVRYDLKKHEVAYKYRRRCVKEERVGNISSSSTTTYKDKEPLQEQIEIHENNGEEVEMGLKLLKQAEL